MVMLDCDIHFGLLYNMDMFDCDVAQWLCHIETFILVDLCQHPTFIMVMLHYGVDQT
jgi:hypothetical protein